MIGNRDEECRVFTERNILGHPHLDGEEPGGNRFHEPVEFLRSHPSRQGSQPILRIEKGPEGKVVDINGDPAAALQEGDQAHEGLLRVRGMLKHTKTENIVERTFPKRHLKDVGLEEMELLVGAVVDPIGVNGITIIKGKHFGARFECDLGEPAGAASRLQDFFPFQVLGPLRHLEEPVPAHRNAAAPVQLGPSVAIPLKTEGLGVICRRDESRDRILDGKFRAAGLAAEKASPDLIIRLFYHG